MKQSIVFALEKGAFDCDPSLTGGKEVILMAPLLSVYSTAQDAASAEEGLNIVEGDLDFFASDGSPLKAVFSKEPYINTEKNTYFPGVYTLQQTQGASLNQVLEERLAMNALPHANIIVFLPVENQVAQAYGWRDVIHAKSGIEAALTILTPALTKLAVFEALDS